MPYFDGFVKSHKIMHLAMLMGITMIGVIIIFRLSKETDTSTLPFNEYLFLLIGAFAWIGSRTVYKMGIFKASQENGAGAKLAAYRTSFIISIAIAEGSFILSIVLYFAMFPVMTLLFCAGIAWIALALLHPTKSRLISELGLTKQELDIYNNGE